MKLSEFMDYIPEQIKIFFPEFLAAPGTEFVEKEPTSRASNLDGSKGSTQASVGYYSRVSDPEFGILWSVERRIILPEEKSIENLEQVNAVTRGHLRVQNYFNQIHVAENILLTDDFKTASDYKALRGAVLMCKPEEVIGQDLEDAIPRLLLAYHRGQSRDSGGN